MAGREMGCKPGTWVTTNVRDMGDSGSGSSVTGSRHKRGSELDGAATNCRHMGDEGSETETVHLRDMGDNEAARSVGGPDELVNTCGVPTRTWNAMSP